MGKLLSRYRKSLVEGMINEIENNIANYYAFAANPVSNLGNPPASTDDLYKNTYEFNSTLLFGKKLANSDIAPMVKNHIWGSGNTYNRYDDLANSTVNTYVSVQSGGYYHIYRCIDNNSNGVSTQAPDIQQSASFVKSDGYMWRYLYSISNANYVKFATTDYIPVTPNATIQAAAKSYTSVDVVAVSNGGSGYIATHENVVRSYINSTVVQIGSSASDDNDFYTNNAIYIYNVGAPTTSQLKTVSQYVVNSLGKWIYLTTPANTQNITPDTTKYLITPRLLFNTDGTDPQAYAVINSSAQVNNVVVLDGGSGITRATATVVSNSVYGSGAVVRCIVPPPGGHGADPASELDVQGIGVSFSFANSETSTIPTNVKYNKIGIYKNPSILHANLAKGALLTDSTFNQLFVANVSPSVTFAVESEITGLSSGSKGIVAYSNSTQVFLVGDKSFSNNETIADANNNSTTITINSHGRVYTADLYPLYTQNIQDATRANNQTESYKIIIKVV